MRSFYDIVPARQIDEEADPDGDKAQNQHVGEDCEGGQRPSFLGLRY